VIQSVNNLHLDGHFAAAEKTFPDLQGFASAIEEQLPMPQRAYVALGNDVGWRFPGSW